MKKKWKMFWIVCAVLIVAGIGLCIVGLAMGASPSSLNVNIGGAGIHLYDDEDDLYLFEEDDDQMESSAVSEDAQSFEHVRKIDVEISSVKLEIAQSEDEKIWVETKDVPSKLNFRCGMDGDELKLVTDDHILNKVNVGECGVIRLYLPKDGMEEMDVKNEAGIVVIQSLNAEEFSLDIGAGEAIVKDFNATEADFTCGAGEIRAAGNVAKKMDVDCGIGEVVLTLDGTEEEYACDVECGVGEVVIGDIVYEGVGSEHHGGKNHNGSKEIEVDCGVGSVTVQFETGV